MVSEILENTQLFLTDLRNSSGGCQINILYYISFVSPTGFRTITFYALLVYRIMTDFEGVATY